MSDTLGKENRATPAATLEQQILDPNHPKNDGEWWAADEITRLRNELHIAQAWSARVIAGHEQDITEITALRAENERLRGQVEFEKKCRNDAFDELKKQDAEIERLRAALEPLACTCDRPNGAACSRSEVDCPFWNARATLEGKQ